jgi:hypothetical protein
MVDRNRLATMGFTKQDWAGVEVWTHEYDFWVKFIDKAQERYIPEQQISGITATDVEFCKKFHDYLFGVNPSAMIFE